MLYNARTGHGGADALVLVPSGDDPEVAPLRRLSILTRDATLVALRCAVGVALNSPKTFRRDRFR
ncbi:hypothetical protein SBA4_6120002 [Candidatus Sulfopaludibacter sp. SbA4]|nr:hypothetical protein SBA4_6120002 [Candidatus Sulfopaludibacter sp. SbA4]